MTHFYLKVSWRSEVLIKLNIVDDSSSVLEKPEALMKLSLHSQNLPSTRARAQGMEHHWNTVKKFSSENSRKSGFVFSAPVSVLVLDSAVIVSVVPPWYGLPLFDSFTLFDFLRCIFWFWFWLLWSFSTWFSLIDEKLDSVLLWFFSLPAIK